EAGTRGLLVGGFREGRWHGVDRGAEFSGADQSARDEERGCRVVLSQRQGEGCGRRGKGREAGVSRSHGGGGRVGLRRSETGRPLRESCAARDGEGREIAGEHRAGEAVAAERDAAGEGGLRASEEAGRT